MRSQRRPRRARLKQPPTSPAADRRNPPSQAATTQLPNGAMAGDRSAVAGAASVGKALGGVAPRLATRTGVAAGDSLGAEAGSDLAIDPISDGSCKFCGPVS